MENIELIDIPSLFGQNVKKYRTKKGLTQEQLSEKLDISQKHLSIIETGTQFASATLISKICHELNVTPGMLFSEEINKQMLYNIQSTIISTLHNEIANVYLKLHNEIEEIKQPNNKTPENGFFLG